MPPSIKLIAIDLDGTLLNSAKNIPPRNAQAIADATKAGITVCLASGRMLAGIRPYAEELGLKAPMVTCNGAYVVDAEESEIHHFAVPDNARDLLYAYAAERNVHMNVYVRDQLYFSKQSPEGELYKSRVKNIRPVIVEPEFFATLHPTKVLFVDDPDEIVRHKQRLTELLPQKDVEITISEPDYIEFLPPTINKGIGVQAVAAHMGLAQSEVAAIGDWLNDLEMVRWAGYSGAVSNAAEAVRLAATKIVATNDEAGVCEFIESIVYN